MARALTEKGNQLALSGFIVLSRPVELDGKKYTKIWAPFWDIFLKKDIKEDSPDALERSNWDWYCVWDDQIQFHANGGKVVHFEPQDEPDLDGEMYIPPIIKEAVSRVLKKHKKKKER